MSFICAALVIGGAGRLVSHFTVGPGTPEQWAGMFIELGSPILLVWLWFVVREARAS
jgi:hypothetical protein